MKAFIISLTMLILKVLSSFGQELPQISLSASTTIHFTSPEPIQYVDYPKYMAADLPIKNMLRLRFLPDSVPRNGVLTIAGEKFVAQYQIVLTQSQQMAIKTNIEILPEHTRPLDVLATLSQRELRNFSIQLLQKKTSGHVAQIKAFGIVGRVGQIATFDDYIFLDLSYLNHTNLNYQIDEIRFKIEDRKKTKASTVQSVEIQPEFIALNVPGFKKRYQNVFAFRKFSFPGDKLLTIEMTEKQISGRVIKLALKYGDLLSADTLELN